MNEMGRSQNLGVSERPKVIRIQSAKALIQNKLLIKNRHLLIFPVLKTIDD
jgi:hypothetical protein